MLNYHSKWFFIIIKSILFCSIAIIKRKNNMETINKKAILQLLSYNCHNTGVNNN